MIIKDNKEAIQLLTQALNRDLTSEESIMSEDSLISSLLEELHSIIINEFKRILK
jgi:hypothetical protein